MDQFYFYRTFKRYYIKYIGYKLAVSKNDWLFQNAYTDSVFIGQSVPHIDPVKEIRAVREALGPVYANVPIIDGELAGQTFNVDFNETLEKANKQMEKINTTNFKEKVAIVQK